MGLKVQRTNPTDIPSSSFVPAQQGKGPQAQTQISTDQKKKQSANVRKILYGRKTHKDWLDELVCSFCLHTLTSKAERRSSASRKNQYRLTSRLSLQLRRSLRGRSVRLAGMLGPTNVRDVRNGAAAWSAWGYMRVMVDVGWGHRDSILYSGSSLLLAKPC